jgi:hypothetical protein
VAGAADHAFEVMSKPYDQVALARRIAELAAGRQGGVA